MQNFNIAVLAIVFLTVAVIWLYSRKKRAALQEKHREFSSPALGGSSGGNELESEGIIAVRKKDYSIENFETKDSVGFEEPATNKNPSKYESLQTIDRRAEGYPADDTSPILVLYVMAKEKAIFSGYELLQVLLAVGLRFGEMNIFHYYRQEEENEEVLFSLASATEPGTFDIRNMSGFSCLGLTLFMKKTGDEHEDKERYELMLQTASHLTEDLDGMLLDGKKNLLFQPNVSLVLEK